MKDVNIYLDTSSSDFGLTILFLEDNTTKTYSIKVKEFKNVDKNIRSILKIKDLDFKLSQILNNYNIKLCVVEACFVNPKFLASSEMVLKVHGFIYHKFKDSEFHFFEPTVIKKVVAHNGAAKKNDIIKAVNKLGIYLEQPGEKANDNMYDSYAIYLTYKHYLQLQQNKKDFQNKKQKEK